MWITNPPKKSIKERHLDYLVPLMRIRDLVNLNPRNLLRSLHLPETLSMIVAMKHIITPTHIVGSIHDHIIEEIHVGFFTRVLAPWPCVEGEQTRVFVLSPIVESTGGSLHFVGGDPPSDYLDCVAP